MGKAIIIKGADFSQVAVEPRTLTWAFGFTDTQLQLVSTSGKTFYAPSDPDDVSYAMTRGADTNLIGHTVTKAKFYSTNIGTLKIHRLDRDNFTVDCVQTLNVTQTGIVEIELATPMVIDANHTIGVAYTSNAATRYLDEVGMPNGYSFDMVTLSTKRVGANNCTFLIDFGV